MTASFQNELIRDAPGPNEQAKYLVEEADGSILENKRHLAGPPGDFLVTVQ